MCHVCLCQKKGNKDLELHVKQTHKSAVTVSQTGCDDLRC